MSINGRDICKLFKNPFNLGEEIKICNVTLSAMGNAYDDDDATFTQWDFNPIYNSFECAMACCIVQMFVALS